jgi:hypothetical protein
MPKLAEAQAELVAARATMTAVAAPAEAPESARLATAEAQMKELRTQLTAAQATVTAIAAKAEERPTATATTIAPTPTTAPSPTPELLAVGDTAIVADTDGNNYACTLYDVQTTDQLPYPYPEMPEKAPTGFNYIILQLGMSYLEEGLGLVDLTSCIYDSYGNLYSPARFDTSSLKPLPLVVVQLEVLPVKGYNRPP